jgi:hypothetical protein
MFSHRPVISELITPPSGKTSELDLNNYHLQLLSFRHVLNAVRMNRPLSIEFICELQLINYTAQYEDLYLEAMQKQSHYPSESKIPY